MIEYGQNQKESTMSTVTTELTMDQELERVCEGMTPQLIGLKSKEYNAEFNQLLKKKRAKDILGLEDVDEDKLFRSVVCYKLAAQHTFILHLTNCLRKVTKG